MELLPLLQDCHLGKDAQKIRYTHPFYHTVRYTVWWETFEGKTKLVKNTIFAEKTFADCSLAVPKNTTPPNFVEKTFSNSHKIAKFTKVLSLKSFPLYGIRATLKSGMTSFQQ